MKDAIFWNVKAYRAVGRYKVLPSTFTLKVEAINKCEMLLIVFNIHGVIQDARGL
jgi:hypothetical protein